MVSGSDGFEGEDGERPKPPLTLEGWRAFVEAAAPGFRLLPDEKWKALDDASRNAYDDARLTYHSETIVVATSTVKKVVKQGRLLTVINRKETGARRGMIISGPQTTGKSTALKELGRHHELRVRERRSGSQGIPVVYVTTPPKGSPRKLAAELARFLGLGPIKSRHNVTDISDAVCRVLIAERCDMILIDEISNLDNGTSAGEDLSDHIKYFAEHIPATFVYAGMNVESSGLLTGPRGKQLAGRCVMVSTSSFPFQDEWRGLVATMEDSLRLHRHEPGTLVRHARYMHTKAQGMIGSLSHLVRAAAATAIMDGTEKIDLKLLKSVEVDLNAQSGMAAEA